VRRLVVVSGGLAAAGHFGLWLGNTNKNTTHQDASAVLIQVWEFQVPT
jgi:hypothetical protein